MPVTTLDPKTALVVVDLQQGVTAMPVDGVDTVVANSAELAHAFRARGLPVVLVNVTGTAPGRTDAQKGASATPPRSPDWADLVPELATADEDILVTKERWGAFTGTDLHDRLQEHGVTQVVLTGISTSAGVESTARSAHELGYHVTLATDAMTDRDPATHEHSVGRIFPRLGETGTTKEILEVLGNH